MVDSFAEAIPEPDENFLDAFDGEPVGSEQATTNEPSDDSNDSEGIDIMTEATINETTEQPETDAVPAGPSITDKLNDFIEKVSADADADDPDSRGLTFKSHMFAKLLKISTSIWLNLVQQIEDEQAKLARPGRSALEFRKLREESEDPQVKAIVAEMNQLQEKLADLRKQANRLVAGDEIEMADEERDRSKDRVKALKAELKQNVDAMIQASEFNDGYAEDFLKTFKEESPYIRSTPTRTVSGAGSGSRGAPKEWAILRVDGRNVEKVQNIINIIGAKRGNTLGSRKVTNQELRAWREEYGQHFEIPGTKHTVTMVKVGEDNDGTGWE